MILICERSSFYMHDNLMVCIYNRLNVDNF